MTILINLQLTHRTLAGILGLLIETITTIIITHTNIIVDDFELCKDYKPNTFIHFLSHFHQDHWQGLTPLWSYGIIFCTSITKRFILNKFPKIENIHVLEIGVLYRLDLMTQCLLEENQDSTQETIEVRVFDANHIPGSAMYLFKGFMGTILHTGDFRFNKNVMNFEFFTNVDELIFDNTYCNPMFDFPTADFVAEQMIKIIEKNKGKRVYIAMGALGKEAIVTKICSRFNLKIVVNEEKMQQMRASQVANLELFTTNLKESWIHIIKRSHRQQILDEELSKGNSNIICINTDFLMLTHKDPDQINYMVPYSLHSNFKEIKEFVKTIKPAILRKLVIPFENFAEYRRKARIHPLKAFQSYLKRLQQNGESGYSELIRTCTNFGNISQNYLQWMHESKSQSLLVKLGLQLEPDRANRKRKIDQQQPKPSLKQQILDLEKQYIYARKQKSGNSLEDIANRLKATNNNHQITQFIQKKAPENIQDDPELFDLLQNFIGKLE